MDSFERWLTEQEDVIRALQPESIVTVYHGTTMQNAYDFCINGIDGRTPIRSRVYLHISGGKPIKFGLFVAPDVKTAFKFGNYVVEFQTSGKDLIGRFPVEMRQNDKWVKDKYPQSFRPTVSSDMLDLSVEPQALYIGLLGPDKIRKVYALRNQSLNQVYAMTREEFIDIATQAKVRQSRNSIFSPEEYNISLADFVHRIAQAENSTDQDILDILVGIYKRSGYLTGIGTIPHSLLRRIERQLDTYIRKTGK